MNIELNVGEQTTAAQTVQDAIPDLNRYLRDLSDSVAASAAGFQGQASTAFGEALSAWFEAAADLGPALETYAAALATVDREHGRNDAAQQDAYGRMVGRLGGAS
jgi:uncharacterized protein YukE